MHIPKPMNREPKNKSQRDPLILKNKPKLKIIREYISSLLIPNLLENLLTSTEQAANIKSGIEVSKLT